MKAVTKAVTSVVDPNQTPMAIESRAAETPAPINLKSSESKADNNKDQKEMSAADMVKHLFFMDLNTAIQITTITIPEKIQEIIDIVFKFIAQFDLIQNSENKFVNESIILNYFLNNPQRFGMLQKHQTPLAAKLFKTLTEKLSRVRENDDYLKLYYLSRALARICSSAPITENTFYELCNTNQTYSTTVSAITILIFWIPTL